MAYIVYRRSPTDARSIVTPDVSLDTWVPSLTRVCPATISGDGGAFTRNWFFHIGAIACGRIPYRVYSLKRGSNAVAECLVSGPSFRFPFMRSGDLQIGLVYTHERCRNQGLARQMVAAVLDSHSDAPSFWWITEQANVASRRVAEVSGFELIGTARRESVLGVPRFQIINNAS